MVPPPPGAAGDSSLPSDAPLVRDHFVGGQTAVASPLDSDAESDVTPAAATSAAPPRRRSRKRLLVEWMIVLCLAALVAIGLRTFVVQAFFVPTGSMEPTLGIGDRILVLKLGWVAGPIHRGSIIVFRHPADIPCQVEAGVSDLVKRVVGMPGETIWSGGPGDNTIYVNGRVLSEPGWFSPGTQVGPKPIPRTTIPAGDYYVMGDNRAYSCDSRYFGPIPASSVVGKVVALVWRNGHPYFHTF